MNVQSPHKWWSTLKSAVFGSSSSLPPLVGPGEGLVCESVGKADLVSDHFDSKQSRDSVDLLVTCHQSRRERDHSGAAGPGPHGGCDCAERQVPYFFLQVTHNIEI